LILVRKIGVPFEPELAKGAIVDGGSPVIVRNEDVIRHAGVEEADFNAVCDAEFSEIERRRKRYIGARDRVKVEGFTAIVIDDGIATGATMRRITMNWGLNNAPGILSLHRPDECRGF
jgi:putative phosphoribosyl transferase